MLRVRHPRLALVEGSERVVAAWLLLVVGLLLGLSLLIELALDRPCLLGDRPLGRLLSTGEEVSASMVRIDGALRLTQAWWGPSHQCLHLVGSMLLCCQEVGQRLGSRKLTLVETLLLDSRPSCIWSICNRVLGVLGRHRLSQLLVELKSMAEGSVVYLILSWVSLRLHVGLLLLLRIVGIWIMFLEFRRLSRERGPHSLDHVVVRLHTA